MYKYRLRNRIHLNGKRIHLYNIICVHKYKVMEIGFEHSLRVTLKPCKILSMGTFFTPAIQHIYERFRKDSSGYLLEIRFYGRSGVFTTSIHLNFYQVMSFYVYIFHFTDPAPPQLVQCNYYPVYR